MPGCCCLGVAMRFELPGGGPRLEGEWADLPELAGQVAALARGQTRGQGQRRQLESALARLAWALEPPFRPLPGLSGARLTLALDRIMRGPDPTLFRAAFACQLKLARFGFVLAARFLRDGQCSADDLAEALAPHDASVALALANQIFLQAGEGRDKAASMALELMPQAAEADFTQARAFLAVTSRGRPGLAHPLREALWEGRIGRDIRGMDPDKADPVALDEARAWLALLDPPGAGSAELRGAAPVSPLARPHSPGREADALLLALAAREDPKGVALSATAAGAKEVLAALAVGPGRSAGALRAGLDRVPEFPPAAPETPPGAQERPRPSGILGFFSQPGGREALARVSGQAFQVEGREFSGRTFGEQSFRNSRIEGGLFTQCRFDGAYFDQAVLEGVAFRGCVFSDCSFESAMLQGCRFSGCRLESCSFAGAVLVETAFEDLAMLRGSLQDARLHRVEIAAARIESCDLSGVGADSLGMRGTVLSGCLLDRARLDGCRFESLECLGVQAAGAKAWDVECQEPFFAGLAAATLAESLAGPAGQGASPLPVPDRQGAATLADWLARHESRRTWMAHLAENSRRLDFGRRVLGPDKAPLLRLLPFLLHSDCFDHAAGLYPMAPPCRIARYSPDPEVLELARRFFPGASAPEGSDDAIAIQGVYTIGSFGTLAQTQSSDLDVWVCFSRGQAAESDVEELSAKLAALEEWAQERFGVETHFYLLDVERVAANDFGVSHDEGSGSAQAMLLKEEFYRTAVLLAGKPPLWWAAAPECPAGAYQALSRDPEFSRALVDLGRIGDIPRAEFFGASLWQIFKSIAAPYKSVMKFGLLESYAARREGGARLLCESLKASMLAGWASLEELDPYARLFSEVHGHYRREGRKEEAALIRLAFLAKSELSAKARAAVCPLTFEESQIRRMYFAFGAKAETESWGYREHARMGELLSRFIVRAYTRLADQMNALAGSAITPEDLTRLGRRIMAAFSKRRFKVEVMPFAMSRSRACEVVYFSASRGEKNAYQWHIQAGQSVKGESRLDLVLARGSGDLGGELAWLVANGVFGPGSQVSADYTVNPVTAKDLQELLAGLAGFFPQESILHAGTAEALDPEAVARAFVAVNLTQPRETRHVAELTAVYQTTWGELFVRTVRPKAQPPYDPRTLLRAVSGMECAEGLELRWFLPARAACPAPFSSLG